MSELKQLMEESKGLPSAFRKDHPIGTVWAGKVTKVEVRQVRDDDGNPETWDNGDAKQQVVVAIQTDQRDPERTGDDGVRGIYIKWWGLQRQALRDCLEEAGAADIDVGGMFAAQYVGDGEQPKNKMFSPAKLMKYEYKAPSPTAGLLSGNGAVTPTTAPVPSAPAAPAPAATISDAAGSMFGATPTVTSTAASPPPSPAPAAPMVAEVLTPPAPAPAASDPMALLASIKAFIALGMTDEQIAGATGADPQGVAAVRTLPA